MSPDTVKILRIVDMLSRKPLVFTPGGVIPINSSTFYQVREENKRNNKITCHYVSTYFNAYYGYMGVSFRLILPIVKSLLRSTFFESVFLMLKSVDALNLLLYPKY